MAGQRNSGTYKSLAPQAKPVLFADTAPTPPRGVHGPKLPQSTRCFAVLNCLCDACGRLWRQCIHSGYDRAHGTTHIASADDGDEIIDAIEMGSPRSARTVPTQATAGPYHPTYDVGGASSHIGTAYEQSEHVAPVMAAAAIPLPPAAPTAAPVGHAASAPPPPPPPAASPSAAAEGLVRGPMTAELLEMRRNFPQSRTCDLRRFLKVEHSIAIALHKAA